MLQAGEPLFLAFSPGRRCGSTPVRKYDLPKAPKRALAVAKQLESRQEALAARHQECGGTGALLVWRGAQLPALGPRRAAEEARGGRFLRNKAAQLGRGFPSREAHLSWWGTWCCCGLVTSAFFFCFLAPCILLCRRVAALLPHCSRGRGKPCWLSPTPKHHSLLLHSYGKTAARGGTLLLERLPRPAAPGAGGERASN